MGNPKNTRTNRGSRRPYFRVSARSILVALMYPNQNISLVGEDFFSLTIETVVSVPDRNIQSSNHITFVWIGMSVYGILRGLLCYELLRFGGYSL